MTTCENTSYCSLLSKIMKPYRIRNEKKQRKKLGDLAMS